ncbi:septum formation inhibitor Maf [Caloranaerobacter azorensis H53214]|uniref:dTTP/UTP pyrophosphatase n=1 Tax=Caloranaerobacter azorensis H53214 TaxID=1156417 RepID=A0A096BKB0_9FIRM|nr:Maf family protein [Caloranaerobacter azorensis]KGG81183.1 septum formation inhibitor Maf [Caloranaerobacter azorensis H53214]
MQKRIILASGSPRRKELLSKFNINFDIVQSDIPEIINDFDEPKQTAMSLAFQKANDVSLKITNGEIVIAADTIVVFEDKILGKPSSEEEAFEMLSKLSGKIHSVITGFAIIEVGTYNKIIDYAETIVKFKGLTSDRIKRYIRTGEYLDKAGAYAIQGYGSIFVEWIKGSYWNVVGLPISKLDDILERYFGVRLF